MRNALRFFIFFLPHTKTSSIKKIVIKKKKVISKHINFENTPHIHFVNDN